MMQTVGLVAEYLVVGAVVLACALYWGRRLFPRARLVSRTGGAGTVTVQRPDSCGGCRGCDGGGCH